MPSLWLQDLANGQVSSPDKLQAWIDDFWEKFPLIASRITSVKASSIIWNVPLPWEALRGSFLGLNSRSGPFEPPNLSRLSGDVLYSNALNLPWSRRYAGTVFPVGVREDIGFVSAGDYGNRKCIVIPDGAGERINIVSVEGGVENDKIEQYQLLTFPAGVKPLHSIFDRGLGVGGQVGYYTGTITLCKDTNDNSKPTFWLSVSGQSTDKVFEIDDARDTEKMLEMGRFVWVYGRDAANGSGRAKVWRFRYGSESTGAPSEEHPEGGLLSQLTVNARNLLDQIQGRSSSCELDTSTDLIMDFCLGPSTSDRIPPAEPTLFVLVENAGSTTHTVYRIRSLFEADSTLSTIAIQSPLGTAADDGSSILLHNSLLCVIGHSGNTLKWAFFDQEAYNLTNANAIVSGSLNIGTTPMRGSACTDGRFVYTMCANGNVARIDPIANTVQTFKPNNRFTGTAAFKSNICFTGKHLIAHMSNASADGESCAFLPS